jgi:hypothetical protein
MKTIEVSDHTKQKLEQLAQRQHRSETEIVDEVVASLLPNGRRSVRGLLKGKVPDDQLLTEEDFEALHQEMVERYGPEAE